MKIVKKSTLSEIVSIISDYSEDDNHFTIYLEESCDWSVLSTALVVELQAEEDAPNKVNNFSYFLETFIIKEWVEDLEASEDYKNISLTDICNRIILYAKHDA